MKEAHRNHWIPALRGNDRLKGLWEISGEYKRMPLSKCHSGQIIGKGSESFTIKL